MSPELLAPRVPRRGRCSVPRVVRSLARRAFLFLFSFASFLSHVPRFIRVRDKVFSSKPPCVATQTWHSKSLEKPQFLDSNYSLLTAGTGPRRVFARQTLSYRQSCIEV